MSKNNLAQKIEFSQAGETAGITKGRVAPHSVDSEYAVLGGVLLDNDCILNVVEVLKDQDFYRQSHKEIWQAMISLWDRREPIDVVTLSTALREVQKLDDVGGVEYLSFLVDYAPTTSNVLYYARTIREMSVRRKLVFEAGKIMEEALAATGNLDSLIDTVEQRILGVSEQRLKSGFSKVGDLVKDSIKHVEKLYVNKGKLSGVPSTFRDFDAMTNGLQGSDLLILAGRPSMGKTALALSMLRGMAIDHDKRVAFFSLEMSKQQIVLRLLCSEARVDNSKVRSGNLAETDFPKLVDAASKLSGADIFIDDTPSISVMEMRAKARRLHREKPLSAIFVDYLQLMKASSRRIERRDQEISEISSSLKALAKELDIPVVALSQLNRAVESRHDKRPIMADLRESGAIEQDADLIGFVYRDEVYNGEESPDKGIAEIIVAKHRNGPVGTIRLGFQGKYTLFVDLDESNQEYDYLGDDLILSDSDDDDLI